MDTKHCMLMLVCLLAWGLCGGCDKPADSSASTSSDGRADGRAVGPTGSIRVTGAGVDQYHVFHPGTKDKVDFTGTGKALNVPAGEYEVELNSVRVPVTVPPHGEAVVPSGTLRVAGLGINLCDVWDEAGKRKLNFKYTGGPFELFEGRYLLKLNNTICMADVKPGNETVVKPGSLVVPGNGKDLYAVYDQAGKAKLTFAFTSKVVELFAGDYTVEVGGSRQPATVEPAHETTVQPKL